MTFGRSDGRGYKSPSMQSRSVIGLGLAIAANQPDPNGGQQNHVSRQRVSSNDIEHLCAKAASAELQKKNTELLLCSEQQRNIRLNVALAELQTQHDKLNAMLCTQREQNKCHFDELEQHRMENKQIKTQLFCQNNQLVQTELQLDTQKKETEKMQDAVKKTALKLEEHKEEKTRLNQVISKKENQLVQQALEIETLTTELSNARRTFYSLSRELHNLSRDNANLKKENETLVTNGEELSFNFAQNNIKYNALETKHSALESKAKDLSMINADLQSSTNALQSAFGENMQALDTLSAENTKLKSKLPQFNARPEHISLLQHRNKLLALVKAAQAASKTKANVIANKEPIESAMAEKVQAGSESFIQKNNSIVTVLREGEWVESPGGIASKKKDNSLPWVQCCSEFTQAVSEDRIRQKHKRPPPSYFKSPTPKGKGKKHKKEEGASA